MKLGTLNKAGGVILVVLSFTVAVPLTIKTFETAGGTWGFGIVGIPILVPLSTYFLFGIAGLISKNDEMQWRIFVAAHIVSVATGLVCLLLFPLLPFVIIFFPAVLAVLGFSGKKYVKYYLFLMIVLAIVANLLLLKWELDFGRSLPLFQFF